MFAKSKTVSNLDDLRKDAVEVIDNLSHLSKKLASAGKSRSEDFAKEISDRIEDDLEKLRDGMRYLNKETTRRAKQLDSHVRANPYMYVIGGLGLGALLGKLFSPKDR